MEGLTSQNQGRLVRWAMLLPGRCVMNFTEIIFLLLLGCSALKYASLYVDRNSNNELRHSNGKRQEVSGLNLATGHVLFKKCQSFTARVPDCCCLYGRIPSPFAHYFFLAGHQQ